MSQRLKLISCEIFYRECCSAIARSVNQIDVEFLPKGLHDIGQEGMSSRLAEVVAAVDEEPYDAILLGYGLCNNGIVGLSARTIPLVVPRAHDCITLFLGSKERYLDYFQNNPGVYFKTSGWIERGEGLTQLDTDSTGHFSSFNPSYEELVEKYGEDNAKFLHEQMTEMTRNYGKMAYIEMGIEPDDRFEQTARGQAEEREWKFEKLAGDMSLIQALLDGPWDEDRFLVIPPGKRIAASFDEGVIREDSP
ncbi:MAG TPA: DUF1638 domain-containing protein [Thermoguttaceae bacterium]|nr:DUF1638 domain-containing protein [Thermoguttaceae bacterium]